MNFKFNALSQDPDSAAEAAEERKMFAVDMASEGMETGVPVSVVEQPPSAAPVVDSAEDAVVEMTAVASGPESDGEAKPEEKKPENTEEDDPEKVKDTAALDTLMRLAAGKVAGSEVTLDVSQPTVSASAFQVLAAARQRDPETERALDDLVSSLEAAPTEPVPEAPRTPNAGDAPRPVPSVSPAPQQMMAVPAPISGQLGELAGRAIAGAVATPFIALTSAARHLANRFQSPGVVPAVPVNAAASLQASKGVPLANTLETITDWKCERIERAGQAVEEAATAIMGTDEFVTWEDDVRKVATERGVAPSEVVQRMHVDADLAPLKDKMNLLWEGHQDKVTAYRAACDDFERNVRNVVKEFPNSEDSVKARVTNSMKRVEGKTAPLPGFGEKVGEYTKALAERVRELARMIAELLTGLMRRLGGRTRTSDIPAP